MKKTLLVILFSLISVVAYASNDKKMAACLPDTLGEYKASNNILTENLTGNVTAVSRQYQAGSKMIKVSVLKIPGGKEIWPYYGGQAKVTIVIVSGRLCVLNVDEANNRIILLVKIDKAYVSPPPFLYRVTISINNTNDSNLVKSIAELLDYDKFFGLYDKE